MRPDLRVCFLFWFDFDRVKKEIATKNILNSVSCSGRKKNLTAL